MKHVAMDGVAPFLPQEIITNILKFLPVKSLIKFQCVCKHWKNLIKTPSFIAAHLHHSTQHRPCLLFHRYFIRNRLQLYFLDCKMQIVEVQNLPAVDRSVQIIGSSNGLLCLRIAAYDELISPALSYLLWNPAFREVRHVPMTFTYSDGACPVGYGSGFNPVVNDYKIVELYKSMYDDQIHPVVCSLGIGSWKQIEVGNLGGIILTEDVGFTVNGAIFWLGSKQDCWEVPEYVVVSFDIAKEEFALIPVPSEGLDVIHGVHVTEFEHRLAMLCSPLIGNYKSCLIELWVLEEGTGESGERWIWAKKYTSSPYSCLLRPITIWRNEIACMSLGLPGDEGPERVRTVMSNFTNTELNVLFEQPHRTFNYVESLVPVSNIHVEES